jgi:hypothetical protein
MGVSDERLAANEAMFRDLNEMAQESAQASGEMRIAFLCECADDLCGDELQLTNAEYERVRAQAAWFVVYPGHVVGEVERVVEKHSGYWIVEKFGDAAVVAEATDPRS